MKKVLLIMPLLVAFAAEGANAPLYFIGPPANYVTYNPYGWNEIEIKEFRGQNEKPVADWIKRAGYPLIKEGGPNGEKNPYVEVDVNGHKVHKYRRYTYEPRVFTKPKGQWVDTNDDGIYEAPKKSEPKSEPITVRNGPHKGKRLDKLVVVYERIPGRDGWICYDAYWVWSAAATGQRAKISGLHR